MYQGRICVPQDRELKTKILQEAHQSKYSVHPGSTKMYQDLKGMYWWPGKKKDITKFMAKCLTYQKVKVEHQKPTGFLQPLEIPKWKWDSILMDFVVGLPKTSVGHDSI